MSSDRTLRALLVVLLLLLAACTPAAEVGEPEAESTDEPTDEPTEAVEDEGRTLDLVATTSIIGDILASIAGDAAEISVLIPSGIDPHQFEASPGDRQVIEEADLVVANGLELEVRLTDILDAAEAEGAAVHHLFAWVHPLEMDDDHGHDDDDHGHEEWDPHVWFDPVRTAEAVHVLGERLDEIDDSREDGTWAAAAEAYAEEILAVHEEIEQILVAVPDDRRKLLTNHEAFGYLADRYGFEIVGAIIPGGATLAEPTAREFRDLAELIREHDLPAIFAETTSPTRLAESLANEVGRDVEVVVLYSESLGEPGSGAESYLGMLRANAESIAEALRG